jgi:hypothetical protein
VLDHQGEYDEALGIYQEVFNIRERVLGEEHPDTLVVRNLLSSWYLDVKRFLKPDL